MRSDLGTYRAFRDRYAARATVIPLRSEVTRVAWLTTVEQATALSMVRDGVMTTREYADVAEMNLRAFDATRGAWWRAQTGLRRFVVRMAGYVRRGSIVRVAMAGQTPVRMEAVRA